MNAHDALELDDESESQTLETLRQQLATAGVRVSVEQSVALSDLLETAGDWTDATAALEALGQRDSLAKAA